MKNRMRENRTYGSVRGNRLPLTQDRKRGVVELSTRHGMEIYELVNIYESFYNRINELWRSL